jgi:hypothetical protein
LGLTHATGEAAKRLESTLGASDVRRLEEFRADIRDVERRIQAIEKHNASGAKRELFAAPLGVPDSWEEHVRLMFDMQAPAFAAEITRVSSFKMSHDVSNRLFPASGVKTPFHSLSHHDEDPGEDRGVCQVESVSCGASSLLFGEAEE